MHVIPTTTRRIIYNLTTAVVMETYIIKEANDRKRKKYISEKRKSFKSKRDIDKETK